MMPNRLFGAVHDPNQTVQPMVVGRTFLISLLAITGFALACAFWAR